MSRRSLTCGGKRRRSSLEERICIPNAQNGRRLGDRKLFFDNRRRDFFEVYARKAREDLQTEPPPERCSFHSRKARTSQIRCQARHPIPPPTRYRSAASLAPSLSAKLPSPGSIRLSCRCRRAGCRSWSDAPPP